MTSHNISRVAVVGAGQMGGGIAQVAAVAGFTTLVHDAFPGAIGKCRALHDKLLARAVEKQKMTQADADKAKERLVYTDKLESLSGADILIEAIVEDSQAKKDLFAKAAGLVADNAILASNTSSISITELATAVGGKADRLSVFLILRRI